MRRVMIFKSEKARDFLLRNGWVFTFRTEPKELGPVWITDGRGRKKIANGRVVWRGGIHIARLDTFLEGSGFSSEEEWLSEIRRLNGGVIPEHGWIHLVLLEVSE
ncbi:MAG TPA: hypothetical protein ENF41_00685 [Candidatus Bathyarchaeota archaeon]|nr:hypothetical protein [Candidatus Bathyarchaeota archaeon]